jgi:hypothetical protein
MIQITQSSTSRNISQSLRLGKGQRRQHCRFDFEAKRRREITRHALHVEAAKTDDFDRWLLAWQWHNPKAAEPVWSLMEAAKRMGADISEAEAVELTQQACAYPKRLSADALAMYLGVSYAQREILRLTTIGSVNVKKRARKELRKRKDRLYQERKRRERGARPHAESLSQTKPWEAMNISRRTWERRRNMARDADSSAPISLSLTDLFASSSSFSSSSSSRKATLIRADDANSSAVQRPFQAVPRLPGYDPVAAALERKATYRNGRGR